MSRYSPRHSKRPAWLDTLKAGDVLETSSGDFRLVRAVHRHPQRGAPDRVWVYFAIRHCSWTGRPYTLYSSADAFLRSCRPVGPYTGGRLTPLDFRLQRAIDNPDDRELSCCAVRGLP